MCFNIFLWGTEHSRIIMLSWLTVKTSTKSFKNNHMFVHKPQTKQKNPKETNQTKQNKP